MIPLPHVTNIQSGRECDTINGLIDYINVLAELNKKTQQMFDQLLITISANSLSSQGSAPDPHSYSLQDLGAEVKTLQQGHSQLEKKIRYLERDLKNSEKNTTQRLEDIENTVQNLKNWLSNEIQDPNVIPVKEQNTRPSTPKEIEQDLDRTLSTLKKQVTRKERLPDVEIENSNSQLQKDQDSIVLKSESSPEKGSVTQNADSSSMVKSSGKSSKQRGKISRVPDEEKKGIG